MRKALARLINTRLVSGFVGLLQFAEAQFERRERAAAALLKLTPAGRAMGR